MIQSELIFTLKYSTRFFFLLDEFVFVLVCVVEVLVGVN